MPEIFVDVAVPLSSFEFLAGLTQDLKLEGAGKDPGKTWESDAPKRGPGTW